MSLTDDERVIVDEIEYLARKRKVINARLKKLDERLKKTRSRPGGTVLSHKRAGTVPIRQIFDLMDSGIKSTELFGLNIKLDCQKLKVFKREPCCVGCGLKPAYFAIECCVYAPKTKDHFMSNYYYLELYGVRNGEEILFTQDHIRPKSKGGGTVMANLQTMCTYCNMVKSDKYVEENPILENLDNSE